MDSSRLRSTNPDSSPLGSTHAGSSWRRPLADPHALGSTLTAERAPSTSARYTILVVDDDRNLRTIVRTGLASNLKNTVRSGGADDDFVGHIGGDDFILVVPPSWAEPVARAIATTFDRDVRALYDPADLKRGWITTTDRRGAVSVFAVMSLSLAIVTDERRNITNYQQIVEVAAELKRFAKKQSGSYIATDELKT